MDVLLKAIDKNPLRDSVVATKEVVRLQPKEDLWGAGIRKLTPARVQTAWLMLEDPLMLIAGDGYRATEVRDRSFELQEEASKNIRGNRALTKAKMGDAMSAMKQTEEQMKVVAEILLALRRIQTVCFDTESKKVWTTPSDMCAWTRGAKTIWIDSHAERMLDFSGSKEPSLGAWLSDREEEGWTIPWPESKETLVDLKKMAEARGITVKAKEFGAKVKKEDYARAIGRALAVEHLGV